MDHKSFVFKFGEFEFREQQFLLVNGDRPVPIEPKALQVLLFLLRNPGRLVKKDEIVSAVWDGTSVSDNSLTRSIATLRRLLGDDAREPRYIATVQTVGYRFLCPVEARELDTEHVEFVSNINSQKVGPRVENRRYGARLVLWLAVASVVLASGWLLQHWLRSRVPSTSAATPDPKPSSPTRTHIRPLTKLPGAVWDPAFSPDAKQVAFIWDGENPGRGDIYVQLLGGDRPLRLTHTSSGHTNSPAWSPNGDEIAYGRCDDNGGGIYIVPALGGPERKITDVACPYGLAGFPQWTLDGKSILLHDRCTANGPVSIVVYALETGAKRCLTTPPFGREQGDYNPILSPDQKTVAFLRWPTAGNDDIYTVPLAGGQPHRLTADDKAIWGMMWLADGKSIAFTSNRVGLPRTFRVSFPGGVIAQETDIPSVGTLSHDGSKVAFVEPPGNWIASSMIWQAELSSAGGPVSSLRQLLPAISVDLAPQISPNGTGIAFQSVRSGPVEIWKCDKDGSNPLKLTSMGGHAGTPRWSPDGNWIAFDARPAAHSRIFVVDQHARNLHMISSESGEYENVVPSWSRDGKFLYFASNRTESYQIWRYELASGKETQVTRDGGFASFESYDGKTLYFSKFERPGIWNLPIDGGDEQRITDALHLGSWGDFGVAENGLYFVDSDDPRGQSILYYNFRTRRLNHVLTFKDGFVATPQAANLGVSRDGRTLLFTQGKSKSSLMLAENVK